MKLATILFLVALSAQGQVAPFVEHNQQFLANLEKYNAAHPKAAPDPLIPPEPVAKASFAVKRINPPPKPILSFHISWDTNTTNGTTGIKKWTSANPNWTEFFSTTNTGHISIVYSNQFDPVELFRAFNE